jgi:hypothetical protein
MRRPAVTIDFDGVIHDAREGWRNGSIYGDVTAGFFDWAEKASEAFDLVIYSARSRHPEQILLMRGWLEFKLSAWVGGLGRATVLGIGSFQFSDSKVHAALHIDDNGFRFEGDWGDPFLAPSSILALKAWNER